MQKRICAGVFALAVIMASAGTARADAILTFAPQMLSTAAGGTVEFDGTLTNTGLADLYLNGDQISFYFSDMTVDDSPFIFNAPLFLSPEGSYTGAFIDVTADAATPSGSYSGSYTIQGGADANTFDNIATADFMVNVGSTVPEPNPFLLIASGLVFISVVRRRVAHP